MRWSHMGWLHLSADDRKLISGILTVLTMIGSSFNVNLCSLICLLAGIVIFRENVPFITATSWLCLCCFWRYVTCSTQYGFKQKITVRPLSIFLFFFVEFVFIFC